MGLILGKHERIPQSRGTKQISGPCPVFECNVRMQLRERNVYRVR